MPDGSPTFHQYLPSVLPPVCSASRNAKSQRITSVLAVPLNDEDTIYRRRFISTSSHSSPTSNDEDTMYRRHFNGISRSFHSLAATPNDEDTTYQRRFVGTSPPALSMLRSQSLPHSQRYFAIVSPRHRLSWILSTVEQNGLARAVLLWFLPLVLLPFCLCSPALLPSDEDTTYRCRFIGTPSTFNLHSPLLNVRRFVPSSAFLHPEY